LGEEVQTLQRCHLAGKGLWGICTQTYRQNQKRQRTQCGQKNATRGRMPVAAKTILFAIRLARRCPKKKEKRRRCKSETHDKCCVFCWSGVLGPSDNKALKKFRLTKTWTWVWGGGQRARSRIFWVFMGYGRGGTGGKKKNREGKLTGGPGQ